MAYIDSERVPTVSGDQTSWANVGDALDRLFPTLFGISDAKSEAGFWGGERGVKGALAAQLQEEESRRKARTAENVAGINANASAYNTLAHLLGIQMQQNNPLGWATLGSHERTSQDKNAQDLMKWMIGERKSDQRAQTQANAQMESAKIRANAPQRMPAPPALKDVALMSAAQSLMAAANKDPNRPKPMTIDEAQTLAQAKHIQNWYQNVSPFLRMNGIQPGGE